MGFRRDGRLCGLVESCSRSLKKDVSGRLGARRDVADHVCPGSTGPGHCFWDRQRVVRKRQDRRAEGEFELLPLRIASFWFTCVWGLGQPDRARAALQPHQNRGLLARMLRSRFSCGGGGFSRNYLSEVAGALLRICRTYEGGP